MMGDDKFYRKIFHCLPSGADRGLLCVEFGSGAGIPDMRNPATCLFSEVVLPYIGPVANTAHNMPQVAQTGRGDGSGSGLHESEVSVKIEGQNGAAFRFDRVRRCTALEKCLVKRSAAALTRDCYSADPGFCTVLPLCCNEHPVRPARCQAGALSGLAHHRARSLTD